jgi:hypothetical protein
MHYIRLTQNQIRTLSPTRLKELAMINLNPTDISREWGICIELVRDRFKQYKIKARNQSTWQEYLNV